MPAPDWLDRTVGDLVTLQRGIDLPHAERREGAIPIMGSFGITGRHSKAACKGPGVTVGRSGASIGAVSYVEQDYWPLNTCLYVRDFHGNNPRFTYYVLKTLNLARLNSGSAQPSLNRNFVHPIPISFPRRTEQDDIAAILGALDDKIDLNYRMNETLETMVGTIFKDWFVDFGPTHAKMHGRSPYLAGSLWSLFPDRMDEHETPSGWQFLPVATFAEVCGGKQLAKEFIAENGSIPVFGGAGLMGYTADHNVDGFVISVGRVGAYCGRFFSFRGKAWINNNASLIRPKIGVSAEWLLVALRHADIETIKKGAAQPFVSNTDIANMRITWPGQTVVSAFSDVVVPLILKSEQNDIEAKALTEIRDLLVPKLISGEIRVKNSEKALEAVL